MTPNFSYFWGHVTLRKHETEEIGRLLQEEQPFLRPPIWRGRKSELPRQLQLRSVSQIVVSQDPPDKLRPLRANSSLKRGHFVTDPDSRDIP